MATSMKLSEFCKRPSVGTKGKKTSIRANFFEITKLPDVNVHHYDVTITPDAPPPVNRRIYEQLATMHRKSDLGNTRPVFDGRKNLFSSRPLPFDSRSFDVILPEDAKANSKRVVPVFKVKIKKAAEINLEELHWFLQGKSAMSNNCLTAIMALDVLIRHQPTLLYVSVGRSFFTPDGAMSLHGGVEVWQGYFQSARPTIGKMMINFDVSATAFFQSGPLVELFAKVLDKRLDSLRGGLSPRDLLKADKLLRNLRIKVIHRGEIQRTFKIFRLTPTPASQTMFSKTIRTEIPGSMTESGKPAVTEQEGPKMDVAEYFFQTYRRRLQYPHLPCVVAAKNVFLPLEVCSVIPGQRYIRKLSERQTADMIKFTCQPPHVRANTIKKGLTLLDYNNNEYLKDFGLKVSTEMATVQARILDPPTVSYHPSSRDANFQPRDGSWNLKDKKVAHGATLGSWGVVVFGDETNLQISTVQSFIRELVTTCQDTGMQIPNRQPPIIYGNPNGDIEAKLKAAYITAGNAVKSQPQLLVCILPNTGVPLYAEIKRVSDTILGISTQCLQMKHMFAPNKQYCANVCLKLNVKLGGMNSFLSPAQTPFLAQVPTILFGADVTHPAPGDDSRPSIASLVGSMDAKAARYAATVRVQSARTESIADLGGMVVELLKTFYQTCGAKPKRILFYRDGVSEGQFAEILRTEITSVHAACKSLDPNYKPTITYVVVQKRHHARFFPTRKEEGDRKGNCLPGTTVDTGIVHPFEFDFYLQSHASLQGTSRPAHYHVLYDENKFTADSLQDFSYKLCHLYARCTRSVSIVPPAYYAHLVAARARFHSRDEKWDDSMSSEGSEGGDGSAKGPDASTYVAVKADLLKVMYFM